MGVIERIASNAPWEPIFGYSRAVKAGEFLAVSGTTATDERGLLVGAGQMYVQARQALLNIKAHVERAGFNIANVIRTRVFTTDISRFAEIARAHREILGSNPPASTLVEVKSLVHPEMLVEIEADVWAGAAEGPVNPEAKVAPTGAAQKRPGVAAPKAKAAGPKAAASPKGRARPRRRK